MRILHCISSLGSGGAERQLSLLAPRQAALGDEVHVCFITDGPNLGSLIKGGVTTHQIASGGSRDPTLLIRVNEVMKQVQPDIVHTWLLQMDVAAGTVALMRRVPWVMSERSCAAAYNPLLMSGASRLALGRLAGAVIANSREGRSMWHGRLRAKGVVCYVPNAVAVEEILAQAPTPREQLGVGKDQPIILVAGRLAAEKNLRILFEAADTVCTESNAVFMICGEGPLEAAMRIAIRNLRRPDQFRLLGYRNDVWGIMRTADLFVNPSLFEGQPNSVLEATVCGCPLLVSDIPAHRHLLPSTTAMFANVESGAHFAQAILEMLRAPEKARRRAEIAAQSIDIPNPGRVAGMYRSVYEQLLMTS